MKQFYYTLKQYTHCLTFVFMILVMLAGGSAGAFYQAVNTNAKCCHGQPPYTEKDTCFYYRDYHNYNQERSLVSFASADEYISAKPVDTIRDRVFFTYAQLAAMNRWPRSPIKNFQNIKVDETNSSPYFYNLQSYARVIRTPQDECEFTYKMGAISLKYSVLEIRLHQGFEIYQDEVPCPDHSLYVAVNLHVEEQIPESAGNLVLPAKITTIINKEAYDIPCIEVGDYGFYNQPNLTSLTIPDTYMRICEAAFSCCDGLTSFSFSNGFSPNSPQIQDGSSLHLLGFKAFSNCTRLQSAKDGICIIPEEWTETSQHPVVKTMFSYQWQLRDPSCVFSDYFMGAGVFCGCTSIRSVQIGGVNPSIPEATFRWCENLESLDLETLNEQTQTTMECVVFGAHSFDGNDLKHVVVPCDTSFGCYAFSNNNNLISFEVDGTIDQNIGIGREFTYDKINFAYDIFRITSGYDYVFSNSFHRNKETYFILNPNKIGKEGETSVSEEHVSVTIPPRFFASAYYSNKKNGFSGLTHFIVGSKEQADPNVDVTICNEAFSDTNMKNLSFHCGNVTLENYALGGMPLKSLTFENQGSVSLSSDFLSTEPEKTTNTEETQTTEEIQTTENLQTIEFHNTEGTVQLQNTIFSTAPDAKIIFGEEIKTIRGTNTETEQKKLSYSRNNAIYLLNPQVTFLDYNSIMDTYSNAFEAVSKSDTKVYGIPYQVENTSKQNDFCCAQQSYPRFFRDYYDSSTLQVEVPDIPISKPELLTEATVTMEDVDGVTHTIPASSDEEYPVDGFLFRDEDGALEQLLSEGITKETTISLTVSVYGTYEKTVPVTFYPKKVVDFTPVVATQGSISIIEGTLPAPEQFTLSQITYNDGDITDCAPEENPAFDFSVSTTDGKPFTAKEQQTVHITYAGQTKKLEVTVIPKQVVTFSAITQLSTLYAGDTPKPADFSLTALYNNETMQVAFTKYTFAPTVLTEQTKTLTVTTTDRVPVTLTIPVTVTAISPTPGNTVTTTPPAVVSSAPSMIPSNQPAETISPWESRTPSSEETTGNDPDVTAPDGSHFPETTPTGDSEGDTSFFVTSCPAITDSDTDSPSGSWSETSHPDTEMPSESLTDSNQSGISKPGTETPAASISNVTTSHPSSPDTIRSATAVPATTPTTLPNMVMPNASSNSGTTTSSGSSAPTRVTIGVKEKIVITLSNATVKKYAISNLSVAGITSTGTVTGKKKGTATITLTDMGNHTYTFLLTVKKAPKKVKLSAKKQTLKAGKKTTLRVRYPKGGCSHTLHFSSSNPGIATVNSKGIVTAKKKGCTRITVKTYNNKKASLSIRVK